MRHPGAMGQRTVQRELSVEGNADGRMRRSDVEREHFDALASAHGEIWWGSTTAAGIRRLERRAKILSQQLKRFHKPKVFELGCGTGAFSKYILEELPILDLTSCDISPKCIMIAAQRCGHYHNAKFLVRDVTSPPSGGDLFDVIVGNSVLHHLPLKMTLQHCLCLLKAGGSIIFFEPNMLNPQIAIEKNFKFFGKILQNTRNETAFFRWGLQTVLKELGFIEVSVTPFDFLHPLIPAPWVDSFDRIGKRIETIRIVREFSGSLFITARKPCALSLIQMKPPLRRGFQRAVVLRRSS